MEMTHGGAFPLLQGEDVVERRATFDVPAHLHVEQHQVVSVAPAA